jgi:hypothetical protein
MARSSKRQAGDKTANGGQDGTDASAAVATAATEAKDQIQEQVGGLSEQLRQRVNDEIAAQTERAADTLDTVALLLHQAGEHATKDDKATLAEYADKASGQVSQWSEKLRDQDAAHLLEETKQFARRQPLLFFGGTLAAGFVGARFFRSSASQAEQTTDGASRTDGNDATGSPSSSTGDDYSSTSASGTGAAFGQPFGADLGFGSGIAPDVAGVLEGYEADVLVDEEPGFDPLTGTDEFTSPEQR